MTTLPQTTAIRVPRQGGPMQMSPGGPGMGMQQASSAQVSTALSGGDIIRVIRANFWMIFILLIASAGAGYGANVWLGRVYSRYTATGYISVRPNVDAGGALKDQRTGMNEDTNLLSIEQKTQAAYLTSDRLLMTLLQNEQSDIRKTTWFIKFKGDIAAAKEDFLDNYSVKALPETRLVKLEFTNSSPEDTRRIVKEVGSEHIRLETERIFEQGQERSARLNSLKARYRAIYNETESRLGQIRARLTQSGSSVLDRRNGKDAQLEQLQREKSTIDINLRAATSQLENIMKSLAAGIDPPAVEQQVEVNNLLQQYKAGAENAKFQYENLLDRLGNQHHIVLQAKSQYDRQKQKAEDYESEVRVKVRNLLKDQLEQNVASQKASFDQLQIQIDILTADIADLVNEMIKYYKEESTQRANSDMLKQVQDQLDLLDNENAIKLQGKVTWAVLPERPTSRSFPQLKYILPIALFIGLLLGLGIAFVRELTDTSIRSPRDIIRVGQMTLLGMVGDENGDPQAAGARLPLVIFDAPHSITAEQMRQVRTRLQHATHSLDDMRSIMVTSPAPGDGKTTIACNLAAGLALNGRRILLVDANFRRPEIHRVFALANEQGFSDVLNGAVNFDDVIQETQVPNLFVMTSGPKPINATEMFESQLLVDFIERCEEFDHVIFDSGPIMVVSESAAMAPRVDGVVSVVRARNNSRGLLARMRELLKANKAEHIGVVLNGVKALSGGYYGRTIKTYYAYQND